MRDKMRLVVLDCPIKTWDNPGTRTLFEKVVKMKLDGYGAEYPDGVIAVDGTDFFGTHLLLCEESLSGDFRPLVGYKSVTLSRCRHYHTVFPALSILRNSGVDDQSLLGIMKNCESRNIELSYDSSWTMLPELRKDKGFSRLARDIISMVGLNYHAEFEIPEWTVCGILRFKTDLYFRWMGHADFVPEFSFYNLHGERATMLHLKQYSTECIELARTHQAMWENKIVIAPRPDETDLSWRKAA